MLILAAWRAGKFLLALAIGYRQLNGLTWFGLAQQLVDRMPKPHTMTAQEQTRWFDRMSGGGS